MRLEHVSARSSKTLNFDKDSYVEGTGILQDDLNNLRRRSNMWLMPFNTEKNVKLCISDVITSKPDIT